MWASAPFKMTLFADLHFEEVTSTDWSPLQDINSTKVMDTMLNDETLEVLVRYVGFGKVEDEWVNVKNEMRERSIPLEPSECPKVKDGDLVLCFLERGDYGLYFDARVVRIQMRLHDATDYKCIFTVRFLHDNSEEEIHWKGVCYRPAQGNSTQEKSVVFHNSPKPTQEKSNVAHNSPGPTIEPSLSDIENLWP
ncbi:protein SAWADEE HOMEODOMAIN HOMOLOG 1-like [Lotus japonicus]|uniref:protein SAWADEE HOMEODOMAIN HOMOLOG 1-like n=1 Tax=Lotus japonicus TaxID=34305 RepID=UPI00258B74AE|nr:protein SAWADEE HOMEODOMAIN HOMOLOG 1-like [Lotus japonicus]